MNRENGKRYITITANVRRRSPGFCARGQSQSGDAKCNTCWLLAGLRRHFQTAGIPPAHAWSWIVPMTLVLILGLLVMAFQSFKDALIIFFGRALGLNRRRADAVAARHALSISAGVGFIALSGVAVLNGLVMLSLCAASATNTAKQKTVIQAHCLRPC